ncbi:hypothetical protein C1894_14880 [Pseudomonas sp. FW305-3-2-15-E-TSA2]|nr:hypothetical protein C1895_04670 [Pseudomonas sp. FW305-3-2-15-E-TSA4]POA41388.1 hypothetical protein C1894_14880 [Pseudomonas sp. FW305-3-2-15-E-TSA2]
MEWTGRGGAQSCDIMQIFRIMCKGLWLEIFLIYASVMAQIKRSQPRFTRKLRQGHAIPVGAAEGCDLLIF